MSKQLRLRFFFCSGREECIYALTAKPLETKTGISLYTVSDSQYQSNQTEYRLNQSFPRIHTSFVALIEVSLLLTFKLCALRLSYSSHNHIWFVFHTKQLRLLCTTELTVSSAATHPRPMGFNQSGTSIHTFVFDWLQRTGLGWFVAEQ